VKLTGRAVAGLRPASALPESSKECYSKQQHQLQLQEQMAAAHRECGVVHFIISMPEDLYRQLAAVLVAQDAQQYNGLRQVIATSSTDDNAALIGGLQA
jgi:hypothetical protein